MADKHPKRPNNNAKAIEGWEGEGGATASDNGATKKKRPRDLNQWAKRMVDVATGEPEAQPPSEPVKEKRRQPAKSESKKSG